MELSEQYFVRRKKQEASEARACPRIYYSQLEVFEKQENGDEKKIGEYSREYGYYEDNFFPFIQKEKTYALFCSDQGHTSVMSLPDCRILATAKNRLHRCFEYYVPYDDYLPTNEYGEETIPIGLDGTFGFIQGHQMMFETLTVLLYVDLSKIEEGIITFDEKFEEEIEYRPLKKIINFDYYDDGITYITVRAQYDLTTRKRIGDRSATIADLLRSCQGTQTAAELLQEISNLCLGQQGIDQNHHLKALLGGEIDNQEP